MLRTIEGNLLEIPEGIICHQVNCQGAFGAGLAKAIASMFPQTKQDYMSFVQECKQTGTSPLGSFVMTKVPSWLGKPLYVASLFGQDHYGNAAKTEQVYTDYNALDAAFANLRTQMPDYKLYAPHHIGCGLAGGDWSIVSHILDKHGVTVVKLPEPELEYFITPEPKSETDDFEMSF